MTDDCNLLETWLADFRLTEAAGRLSTPDRQHAEMQLAWSALVRTVRETADTVAKVPDSDGLVDVSCNLLVDALAKASSTLLTYRASRDCEGSA